MNTKRITFALVAAALAATAVTVAAFRTTVGVDGVIGYGAVIALIALAATEYGIDLRRVLGLK